MAEIFCPNCSGYESRVINSRYDIEKHTRRRRYICNRCQHRFTTYEITVEEYEKIQAVKINPAQFDSVIASLRAIKVQFGARNGTVKN